ncbi:hypothetical protein NQ315_005471 [Exocentrus adspersus]|uniref:Sodium-coupled monocarboxylate transporter 1 n=1 Tax=Exocentrus adspersus TaxID=1586481 RepID=A0AAV8VTI5_9CUCU|nr:hypothetical protein NQ315_005471 [Exocentrus adspersus]
MASVNPSTTICSRLNILVVILILCLHFCLATPQGAGNIEGQFCEDGHVKRQANRSFLWEDYTVLACMLVVSCGIGIFFGFCGPKHKNSDDFLLGGSSMGAVPMGMSLAASLVTAIELLGNPAEMYMHGSQFWMICVPFLLVAPITSKMYLPVFMSLRLTSSYEYLSKRFCPMARYLAGGLYIFQMLMYTSVAVYAPALALSSVTGLNVYLAVVAVYAVCIFYSSQGGMKAVIIADTYHLVILLSSIVLIMFIGENILGDFGLIWSQNYHTNRLEIFNFNPNPTVRHTFWSVVIGGTVYWTSMFCSNQASIQKYLSVSSIGQVRSGLWIACWGLIAIYTTNFFTGMMLVTNYRDCDPISSGEIGGSDEILPLYITTVMGHLKGLTGYFVAGIFAASLGTVAAALNSLAAVTIQDFIETACGLKLPDRKGALVVKLLSVAYGAASFGLVFVVAQLGSIMQVAISFNGVAGGITLGLFSLGMFGAIVGSLTAVVLVSTMCFGQQICIANGTLVYESKPMGTENCPCLNETEAAVPGPRQEDVFVLFRVSYIWYSAIGYLVTFILGTVVSILTGPSDPKDLDESLLSPPVKDLLKRLPNRVKKSFNLPYKEGDGTADMKGNGMKEVFTVSVKEKRPQRNQWDENGHEMVNRSSAFSWVDYTVLGLMLIISCGIGIFYGFCGPDHENSEDFLLGGSTMGTFPMAMSLAASFVTAVELLGNPAEMYTQGSQFWMICIPFILVVPLTSKFYLPVFMKLRLTSSYEYLSMRFCPKTRYLASGLYIFQMVLYTSVAVYAPALALSSVTGLNVYLAVTAVYAVCIFYSSQGGMKAVIIADTFQAAVLLGSITLIMYLGQQYIGNQGVIWSQSYNTDRLEIFNFSPSLTIRHSFWSVVVGGTFYWMTMFCSNQASIQKYLSVEGIDQVRRALWVSSAGLILIYSINFYTGMIIVVNYKDCDPLSTKEISASDEILPLYIITIMGALKGLTGFFVAGIFAASLGTVASALNSLAAVTMQDFFATAFGVHMPDKKGALVAKGLSVVYGAVSFGLVFIVAQLGSVMQVAISFNGMVGGVTLGLFSLGMFFPWANSKGALFGSVVAVAFITVMCIGQQISIANKSLVYPIKPVSVAKCPCCDEVLVETPQGAEPNFFFRISYIWYAAIGYLITFILGVVVSLITGPTDPRDVDEDLLSPPINTLLTSLPEKVKRTLSISLKRKPSKKDGILKEIFTINLDHFHDGKNLDISNGGQSRTKVRKISAPS